MNTHLPVLREPVDVLRQGPGSLKGQVSAVHPVQLIEQKLPKQQMRSRKMMMAQIHGSHLPMRMEMEEAILGQFRRLPGLQSSMLGLNTMLQRDETIEFNDFLGDPQNDERQVDLNALMERRFDKSVSRTL
eukprot:TRINITY_DN2076_c0_g1_i1.p2 TRINITY_DN2076_c0_g1~~TRINITY_DN2076_c0_g1_i1.p2  ORF type:complete len:149 (-),score=51.49 TRINITY_DN2076_c0_g1_i1:218-610(-)